MAYTINTSYKAKYYGSQRTTSNIKYIVIHYTANSGTTATAKSNANYFATTTREASAHYVVDENSIIYQCVPDNYVAWSVGDTQAYTNGGASMKGIILNSNSISIEMVSHSNSSGNYYIPDSTLNNTAELVKTLMKTYGLSVNSVYRHYDVTGKLCPATHCKTTEGEANWVTFTKLLTTVDHTTEATAFANEIANVITISDKATLISQLNEYYNGSMYWVIKKLLVCDFNGKIEIDGKTDIYRRALQAVTISDKDAYNNELLKAGQNSLFWVIVKLLNKLGIK